MKLLFINGSPHKDGCTAAALREVSRTLEELGIETETHWVGNKPVPGCIACGSCSYVCPAKRFLAARVSLARGTARRLNQQKATRKEAAQ